MSKRGETGWQQDKGVLDCNKYMLDNAIASDVVFRVRSPGGDTEVDLPAHSYVLVSRSPVFEAMFLGSFADDQEKGTPPILEISDVEPDAFSQLLSFLYYEAVTLTPDNVLPVLYAAKKYLLNSLAKRCMDFLERKITEDTVCTILNHSILYEETELTEKCLAFISPKTESILKGDFFSGLSSAALLKLLESDYLYVNSEVEVLQASIKWACAHSSTQNANVTDLEIRKVLGDNLSKIRFSSMSAEEFARAIGKRDILTSEEKSRFYYHLLTGDGQQSLRDLGFDLKYRVQRCLRYPCLGKTAGWWTCNGPGDAITFSVDQPIVFIGVSLYGGREPSTHSLVLELFKTPDVLLKRTEQKLESDGSCDPIPVYFGGSDVVLDEKEQYSIVALMKGPISYYGQGGTESIVSRGVTFQISRSDKSGNGTNIKSGQIPELLFLTK